MSFNGNLIVNLPEEIELTEAEENEMLIELRSFRRSKEIEKLNLSGMGKRFISRRFSNLKVDNANRKAVYLAKEFCESLKKDPSGATIGLALVGNVGLGKTHIACVIANELLAAGLDVSIGNITDIINKIKESYSSKSTMTESEIIRELTNKDLLIIDDLGKEIASENTKRILYLIINKLYEDMKPIVITSKYSLDRLKDRYGEVGEDIASRLAEMVNVVCLKGSDRRRVKELG